MQRFIYKFQYVIIFRTLIINNGLKFTLQNRRKIICLSMIFATKYLVSFSFGAIIFHPLCEIRARTLFYNREPTLLKKLKILEEVSRTNQFIQLGGQNRICQNLFLIHCADVKG